MKFRASSDIAGGLYDFQQKGNKIVRGAVTSHLSDLLIWEAGRIRLQNADRLVDRCNQ